MKSPVSLSQMSDLASQATAKTEVKSLTDALVGVQDVNRAIGAFYIYDDL